MISRFVLFSFLQLLIVGLFLFSNACDDSDDGGSDSSGDTDSDTDSDSDGDADETETDFEPIEIECAEKKGKDTGDKCSQDDLCNCDNVCGYQVINQNMFGKKPESNYCFAKCDPEKDQCPGETDICWEMPRKPSFCAATGTFKVDDLEMKLFSKTVKRPGPANYILDLDIDAKMDGEKLPDLNYNIAKKVRQRYTSLAFTLYKEFKKDGADWYDGWIFTITMTNKKWGKGTFSLENKDFTGFLTHGIYEVDSPADGRYWLEGSAYEGTLIIEEAPEPCDSKECETTIKGSLDVKLVGTKYEYDFAQSETDTDAE